MQHSEEHTPTPPVADDVSTESPTTAEATPALSELEQCQAELAAAQAEAAKQKDLALRTLAEMENLRKRTEREVENSRKFALERFARDLLAVRDALELGIAAAQQETATLQTVKEGLELTLNPLVSALERNGIVQQDPTGQAFDAHKHEAVSTFASPDHAAGTVINVMQKGYTLHDRVLRPAMVVVAA